jgi:hypothetical protein
MMINDRLGDLRSLPRQEFSSFRAAFPFRFQGSCALKAIGFNPDTDGLRCNSKELGNFLLLFTVQYRFHG